jgi:hypothetical protein
LSKLFEVDPSTELGTWVDAERSHGYAGVVELLGSAGVGFICTRVLPRVKPRILVFDDDDLENDDNFNSDSRHTVRETEF